MPKIILNQQNQPIKNKNLRTLYVLGFLLALAIAIPTYIQSNYLESFVGLRSVSLFFIAANFCAIIAILFYPAAIKRFRNYNMARITLAIFFLATLTMAFTQSPVILFFALIFLTIGFDLLFINMDILLESFSAVSNTGRVRTVYFTCINLGWVLSPLIAGLLAKNNNYRPIFLVAALCLIPFYIIFARQSKNLQDHINYTRPEIIQTFKKIWQTRDIRGIFSLSLLLQLFYGLAVVYMPIHLHQNIGFSWETLGLMFAFMLLPFIIFEIPAGILADKYIGEKEIMTVGFTILIVSLILFFFVDSTSVWLWGGILFFSRTGASLVEAMREAYFFKKVKVKDVSIINFFRTTIPMGYLLSTLLGVIILTFYPVNYIFIILAVVMISSLYFISIIHDTK